MSRGSSPPLLTIAGSDPTAGAGVEADLLTFARHGVHGVAVITALTTQDTRSVSRVGATSAAEFRTRLRTLLEDVAPRAWKIGLIPHEAHVRVIAAAIDEFEPEFVVLDPIVAATSGPGFLDRAALAALRLRLLPRTTIVTPNLDEAAALLAVGRAEVERAPEHAARRLLALGPRAVLLKGGHGRGRAAVDLLVTPRATIPRAASRRKGSRADVHGTGCALSAALLVALARGDGLERAVAAAKRFVTRAIDDSAAIGAGRRRLGLVARGIRSRDR